MSVTKFGLVKKKRRPHLFENVWQGVAQTEIGLKVKDIQITVYTQNVYHFD